MGFKSRRKKNKYQREYYKENRDKYLEYMKNRNKNKVYNKEYSLRALKAWRTRREEGWNTIRELNRGMDNKKEIQRLNKKINELSL